MVKLLKTKLLLKKIYITLVFIPINNIYLLFIKDRRIIARSILALFGALEFDRSSMSRLDNKLIACDSLVAFQDFTCLTNLALLLNGTGGFKFLMPISSPFKSFEAL